MELQINGVIVAGWDTLPRVTPLQWPNWGNSIAWGGIGDYLSDDGHDTPDMRIVASTASMLEEPYWRIDESNPLKTAERIINEATSLDQPN